MKFVANQTFQLIDAGQRQIGQVTIQSQEDHLICGTFIPGPDYGAVKDLFQQFEKSVNLQALSTVDELDPKIDALGLRLYSPINAEAVDIHDVQIWSDGNITCKIYEPVDYQQFIMEGIKGLPPEALAESD